jgi:hypothetical protein
VADALIPSESFAKYAQSARSVGKRSDERTSPTRNERFQSITASVNNVLNIMASPYDAAGDGKTDDLNAIQQAIYDACGTNPPKFRTNGTRKTVYLPHTTNCYLHSKPIRIPCSNLELKGDNGSALCQSYTGDAIIQEGWGYGRLQYGAPLVGSGHSLISAPGPVLQSIDLARFLNGQGSFNLKTRFSHHGNIAFFIKATALEGQILGSRNAYPGIGSGAFSFAFSESNEILLSINLANTGLHRFKACPPQLLGSIYEVELDWDERTYRIWQGVPGSRATLCDSLISSDGILQGPFEEIMLPDGGPHQFWPDGSSNQASAFTGFLDSLRFEPVSIHASPYVVPRDKFKSDGATYLLENFDESLDGTQVGYTSTNFPVYFVVMGAGVVGATAGDYIHDLELCAGANPGAGRNPDGIFARDGNGSRWINLSCSNAYYAQADFFAEDFLAKVDNWNGFGGHVGLDIGIQWADSKLEFAGIDGTDVACTVYQGGGGGDHEDSHSRCVDRGSLHYGWIENESQANYYYPFIDQEANNSDFLGTFLLNRPAGPYIFYSGNIDTRNGAPYVLQDNGGFGSTFIGMIFNDFTASRPAKFIVDYLHGSPTTPTQLINSFTPVGVPLSNQLGDPWVQVISHGSISHPTMRMDSQAENFTVSWANQDTITAVLSASALKITLTNPNKNTIDYLQLCQDPKGSRTSTTFAPGIGIAGSLKWEGGVAPSLTSAPNKCDRLKFYFDGTDLIGRIDVGNF